MKPENPCLQDLWVFRGEAAKSGDSVRNDLVINHNWTHMGDDCSDTSTPSCDCPSRVTYIISIIIIITFSRNRPKTKMFLAWMWNTSINFLNPDRNYWKHPRSLICIIVDSVLFWREPQPRFVASSWFVGAQVKLLRDQFFGVGVQTRNVNN